MHLPKDNAKELVRKHMDVIYQEHLHIYGNSYGKGLHSCALPDATCIYL